MKSPQLFILFEHFSDEDFLRFDKYLKSPYFTGYLKLYSDILKIIRKNTFLLAEKRHSELREIIVCNLSCSDKTAVSLMSRMSRLVPDYLKIYALEKNKLEGEFSLCEHLLDTGNFYLLGDSILKCREALYSEEYDEDIYLNLYRLDYLNYRASAVTDSKLYGDDAVTGQQEYTLNSARNLFVYTLTRLVILHANYVILNIDSSRKNPSPYPVQIKPMLNVINSAEFKSYGKREQRLIILYKYFFQMFSNLNDNESYFRYKKQFNKIRGLFSEGFSKSHYNVMMNYCNLRHRVNDKEMIFYNQGLDVSEEYIQEKMYMSEFSRYLSPVIYRNYVIRCNMPEHKNRLDKFIGSHTGSLHKTHSNEMHIFARAFYFYLDGQYAKALKNIKDLKRTQFIYKYDIKNLELRIYFDMKKHESMESILHNYYINIKKETLFSKDVKDKYYRMLNYTRELIKTSEKYDGNFDIKEFGYLLRKIGKEPGFVMKEWMVNRINTIIKNHNSIHKA